MIIICIMKKSSCKMKSLKSGWGLFPNQLLQDFFGKSFWNFRSMSGNPFRRPGLAVYPLIVATAMSLQFATVAR